MKTPAHLAGYGREVGFQSRPKVWKRLRLCEGSRFRHFGAKVPRLHQGDGAHVLLDRVGVGWGIWSCTGLQALLEKR